jgi:dihydroflavonol-4-reductase
MKILVVGGTGMIGGHAALHLQALGHDVSVAGRNPPHLRKQQLF